MKSAAGIVDDLKGGTSTNVSKTHEEDILASDNTWADQALDVPVRRD
jgi:hypothetical protein